MLRKNNNEKYEAGSVLKGTNFYLEGLINKNSLRVREVSRLDKHTAKDQMLINCTSNSNEYFFDVKSMASARTYGYRIYCCSPPKSNNLNSASTSTSQSIHDYIRKQEQPIIPHPHDHTPPYSKDRHGYIYDSDLAWDIPTELDVTAMRSAANYLLGMCFMW